MTREIVFLSGKRTGFGAFGGSLKDMHAASLAAVTMKEAVHRAGIDPLLIDDIRYGCCLEPCDALTT